MKSIPTTPVSDKVILIHNGAIGDFLNVWPSAWAMRKALPTARLCWAGCGDRLRWLEPLGFSPCPPEIRRALDRLHGAALWTDELEDWLAFWFVIDKAPNIAPDSRCWFVKAIGGGSDCRPAAHVRECYASNLSSYGIPTPEGWLKDFRRYFASGLKPGNTVLLFPGAGHPTKQWPLVQYFQLAGMLRQAGFEPVCVVGPAELERGMDLQGMSVAAPGSLEELEELILTARAVVGGDTGPMHLAGMLGVPGVSLFGPTSFAQWSPVGMREVSLALPCSPCTATCADLSCGNARCLGELPPALVMEELAMAIKQNEKVFQGPGIP
ncbi:MAG: glycosyltransferase family 9 protein [Desulfovibrio sp.]|nr:glycosyltransferase family 9 protein [Desulfovibrio sp.]MBI4960384.1 glycosyltransferase family 9 protein [Desulfovibrio sp.]